jgi:hypothetical protein
MLDQTFFPLLGDVDDDAVVKEDEYETMGSLAREMEVRGVVEVEKDILLVEVGWWACVVVKFVWGLFPK